MLLTRLQLLLALLPDSMCLAVRAHPLHSTLGLIGDEWTS